MCWRWRASRCYWWQGPSLGEPQARALALIVLLSGYQILIFAERLALPTLAVAPVPRTLVFWAVWSASALSLLVILYVPAAAQMFRVERPGGAPVLAAVGVGVMAVGWRLILSRRGISDAKTAVWDSNSG